MYGLVDLKSQRKVKMKDEREIVFKIPRGMSPPEPSKPSAFEMGVVDQLKGLASEIEGGFLHIQHFSLTVTGDKQRLEIEVQ